MIELIKIQKNQNEKDRILIQVMWNIKGKIKEERLESNIIDGLTMIQKVLREEDIRRSEK